MIGSLHSFLPSFPPFFLAVCGTLLLGRGRSTSLSAAPSIAPCPGPLMNGAILALVEYYYDYFYHYFGVYKITITHHRATKQSNPVLSLAMITGVVYF